MNWIDVAAIALIVGPSLALAHSYVFYPAIWLLIDKFFPHTNEERMPGPASEKVTIIVAAHNEEAVIADRVANCLALDYPADLLEVIIASDGSADATVERARLAAGGHPSARILDFPMRRGKSSALNDAVAQANSDVLVFSDANVEFDKGAITALVHRLRDPKTACVCGKLCFKVPANRVHAYTEGLYWRLETWLKEREGRRGMALGVNGAIFAMRRDLWRACPADSIVEDFFIPMRLLMDGWKVTFEPQAVAWEDLPPLQSDEFGRRIRIGAGDFQALSRLWPLLLPHHGWAAFVFLSHKVLRWLGPFFLITILCGTVWLSLRGFALAQLLLTLEAFALAVAWVGLSIHQGQSLASRVAGAAGHFLSMNAALFLGFFRWLRRSQSVAWRRTRRADTPQSTPN
ncbi:MAG: glycosyltransferase family 2 protein [Roseimicrobium sp.]